MSAWQATHSTILAARGLDMAMPGDITLHSNDSYFGANLTAAVEDGHGRTNCRRVVSCRTRQGLPRRQL
ncbi:hypothetical protein AG1IA_06293 [Rhizoctonia solani AG-1 IA]|uniref:Uncharacterized protein n=1 Tax=Thanatephorus cucumeris (strain AG1-IA) TaxID=983506 RepID=L8WSE9_THACA|nr:hypothetical protein AG1IA_06293 [Rhizoctonia solani AG-1 IA]